MRFIAFSLFFLLATAPAQARVFKCLDGEGGVTYQQTPCKGEVRTETVQAAKEDPAPTGYNAECTHYNGRRVLSLKDVSALPDGQRDEYLGWLLSDEAPSKEEKQACLTGRRAQDPAVAAADLAQEEQARADRDAAAAIEAYSLFRTFARQISVCRDLAPEASHDAQDLLDSYLEDDADLHAQGRRLARTGVSVGGEDGETLTPAQIERGIREKENEITARFRAATPTTTPELIAECEAVAGMIEFQQSLSGS